MLTLPQDVYDDLVDNALEGAPEEVCGVLGGVKDGDRSRVTSVRRTANVSSTPETAYAIDPAEQFACLAAIEAAGDEVVGFYHSHPAGPPGPSVTDARRATWPDVTYCIVVLDGRHPFVGAWRWRADAARFEPEVVRRT